MKDIGLKTFKYFNRILINKWLQFVKKKLNIVKYIWKIIFTRNNTCNSIINIIIKWYKFWIFIYIQLK